MKNLRKRSRLLFAAIPVIFLVTILTLNFFPAGDFLYRSPDKIFWKALKAPATSLYVAETASNKYDTIHAETLVDADKLIAVIDFQCYAKLYGGVRYGIEAEGIIYNDKVYQRIKRITAPAFDVSMEVELQKIMSPMVDVWVEDDSSKALYDEYKQSGVLINSPFAFIKNKTDENVDQLRKSGAIEIHSTNKVKDSKGDYYVYDVGVNYSKYIAYLQNLVKNKDAVADTYEKVTDGIDTDHYKIAIRISDNETLWTEYVMDNPCSDYTGIVESTAETRQAKVNSKATPSKPSKRMVEISPPTETITSEEMSKRVQSIIGSNGGALKSLSQ